MRLARENERNSKEKINGSRLEADYSYLLYKIRFVRVHEERPSIQMLSWRERRRRAKMK